MFLRICYFLLLSSFLLSNVNAQALRKVVLIAGPKTHPPAMHEYIKTVRLLKVMLDAAPNLENIETSIVYDGWPEDESVLDDANLILMISDGQDGHLGYLVPFMEEDRMRKMEKLIERGCGLMTFHFSTFAPDELASQILEWTGGYFDWANDRGEREWYSAITMMQADVQLSTPAHPISNGVRPFFLKEEFYYNMRFPEIGANWTPIADVPALESDRKHGNVVAWTVERENGGRGFGTTMGHFFTNWKNDDFRKLMLNAIVWTAGGDVPINGVDSRFYSDDEVTKQLFGTSKKGLVLTADPTQEQVGKLQDRLISEFRISLDDIHIDISRNFEDLYQYDLRDYDVLLLDDAEKGQLRDSDEKIREVLRLYRMAGGKVIKL